jgi:type I restriction enzyme, S subunit
MKAKTKTTAAKEEAKPALVPKLRFPEFREAGEWKPITLEEASIPVTERVGERKLTPVSISAGIGFVPQAEKFGRDISGNQYQVYTLVRDGDFVFNKGNSLKFPQGCVYLLQGWGQVAAPNVFICFRLKKGYLNGFFQQCFEQNQHGRELKRHITSGARSNGLLNISKETFFGVEIPTPGPAEQQKIAECLSSVDELMAAQARKVDALKTHKKGLMQQLFPREGETQPRLRFPEFQNAGEWEPTSLGSVARLRNGYAFKSAEYVDEGPYQIITIANVQQGNLTIESTKRMPALPSDIQEHQVLNLGDILISMTGNVGRVCRVTAEGLLLNQRVGKLVPEKIDAAFFYQLLQRDEFRNAMQLKAAGGAQGNLSGGDITEYAFTAPPTPAEQQRIATCLSSLDALITAETQKDEALKTHKKALMQQLFPAPTEQPHTSEGQRPGLFPAQEEVAG